MSLARYLNVLALGAALPALASASILVVAPHPDDDVITAAGVVHHARSQAMDAQVVYMTNGDYLGISRGLTRQDEAVDAQTLSLSAAEGDLIFLGYPDGSLKTVYDNYPNASDQYTSPLGQSVTYGVRGLGSSDYHTYRFGTPAKYNRANMVTDLADVLMTYWPDHIYTVSEFDAHTDHATTYRVLLLALARARTASPSYAPVVHKTIVWVQDPFLTPIWPAAPTPLDPTLYHTEPPGLAATGLVWTQRESLDVPPSLQSTVLSSNPKYRAIQSHVTQGGAGGFIGRFVHKDEFFWPENHNGPDRPPRASAGNDQSANAGTRVVLNGAGSIDPDGDALAYDWIQTSGPAVGALPAAATPDFISPAVSSPTVLGFRLVVTAGALESAPDLTHVTVQPAPGNQPPSANAGADQSVNERTLVTLVGSGADSDGVISSYAWSQVAGPGIQLSGANTATVTFTAPSTSTGVSVTLRLQVTDNQNAIASDTVVVSVTPVDDPPIANAGADQAVDERTPVLLAGSALDPDGAAIVSYSWAQVGGPAVTLENASQPSANFIAPEVTEAALVTLSLTVRNSGGLTGTDTVTVIVNPVNDAPIAVVVPAQTVQAPGTVTLDGSASRDPDGDALSYRWVQTGGPNVGTLPDAGVVNFPAPVQDTDAVLTFQLIVRDAAIDSTPASATVGVTAPPNVIPTASAGTPLWVKAKRVAGLQGSASDPDGSIVSYVWRQLGGPGVSLNNPNASATSFLVPKTPKGTVFTFELTATDNRGATASSTVNVTVGKPPKVKT
jgi:LmbE family N-acetylglucosaminyl deacetylase